MDINMPEMNGIEATAFITNRWPNIKIIMSTVFDDEQNLFNAIMAGASGYLLKDEPPQKIHRSIYEALEGGAPMSPLIAKKALSMIKTGVPEESKKEIIDYGLTDREIEVLEHLSKGLSYEQIADNLFISYGTVRKHVENTYRKLKVNNRIEAIDKAKKGGVL
jgi:DNA-binding NarL/FixJ family response regulator